MSQESESVTRTSLQKRLAELEDSFQEYMRAPPPAQIIRELPDVVTLDQAYLVELNARLDKLEWLSEGPDNYETIDDTISTTQESRYSYSPYVVWAVNITNNAATGGPNLLFRFTDSHGRIKQYKLPPGSFSLKDTKGSLGSVFNVIADTGPVEMIAFVSLRLPYGPP